MPAIAALSLKNSAGTATAFTPMGTDANGVTTFMSSAATFDARKKVTASVTLPRVGSSVSRLKYKVVVPILDGAGVKTGEIPVEVSAIIPKGADASDANDALAFTKDLLATSAVAAAFASQETFY